MGSMHAFSIELKSKEFIKNLSIPSEGGKVVIEGYLGKLKSMKVLEDVMLEIEGDFGTFCLDFDEVEIAKMIPKRVVSGA